LALSLESFWRHLAGDGPWAERVVAFMAGGDVALIRSIEGFEDHREYGPRQLAELGYGPDDMLVACTEGGETPFVLSVAEAAVGGKHRPWLLYNNPDHLLRQTAERCRRVLDNPQVRCGPLVVGPMAISGSTRLQSSTALMLAVGACLLPWATRPIARPAENSVHAVRSMALRLRDALSQLDMAFIGALSEAESSLYQAGGLMIYAADEHAITVLTDTTERAPTFSMVPFENQQDSQITPALVHLAMPSQATPAESWHALLGRPPRALEWPEVRARAGLTRLLGFDISRQIIAHRARLAPHVAHRQLSITTDDAGLRLQLGGVGGVIPTLSRSLLEQQLLLKIVLNTHSNLVMGRLRFGGNVMTWVRPANNKLIDRAIRYAQQIVMARGRPPVAYSLMVRWCFEEMEALADNQSIVLRLVQRAEDGLHG
jgi:N-acetylmuramic acid 6-phosphate etherase